MRAGVRVTRPSSTDWELTIDLPLGVVASQLLRIEEQLRLLNMKVADLVKERNSARNGAISVRLEHINKALDSIRTLMADIETDIDTTRRKSYPERDD